MNLVLKYAGFDDFDAFYSATKKEVKTVLVLVRLP